MMKKMPAFGFSHIMACLLMASLVAAGVFHDYIACIFGAVCSVVLAVRLLREKRLRVRNNLTVWTVGIILVSYGLSAMWAVDSGMAFIGFMKVLPVGLFLLLMLQEPNCKQVMIQVLPGTMAVLTAISALCSLIPGVAQYVLVADRLAGTMQYPNTFALLLLVSQLLLVAQKKWNIPNILVMTVLLLGLVYSGSRTVFALAIPAHLALALLQGSKKQRLITAGAVLAGGALVLTVAALSGSAVLERFLRLSFSESTFAGRFLYWRDALIPILKHPFGLGYYGYYYTQASVQTGVYATVFAHNDFLQLMLDVGWVPAVLLMVTILKTLFGSKTALVTKVILAVMFLHFCFDFDLQFNSVFFVLLLFLDTESGKEKVHKTGKVLPVVLCSLAVVCLYMGVALGLPQLGKSQAARAMYAPNTQNNVQILLETEDPLLAQEILEQNEYVLLAHSVMARYDFSQGNFTSLISRKREIFRLFPFQSEEYIQYCQMLLVGMELYSQAGDSGSADFCRQELLQTADALQNLDQKLSPLGRAIADQPNTQLPEELMQAVAALEVTG